MKKDAKPMYNDTLCVKKKKDTKKFLNRLFLYERTGNALKGYTLMRVGWVKGHMDGRWTKEI